SRDRIRGYTLEHEKNTLLERLNAEVERRRLTQDQLEYHQKHLEHLIEERTLQLEQSNRELNREIEERKQTQQALQVSEERFRIAGKAAYDLIFEWDVAAGSIEWHGDIDGILHYPTGEVSATLHTWLERIHPDDIDAYREIIKHYRGATDPLCLQHRVRHHDGGYRHWSNHAIPILDGQGRPSRWIGVCTDITEQIEHQRQLEYAAHHDILTNLPNRILLADRLQQALTQAEWRHARLMVAYLDLDGFKEINDAHGHSIGDHLLINLASRLHEILREGDTIARLGGDEFVLVLLDVQEGNERASLLRRILDTTSQPVVIDDKPLQVSGSLGVTVYPLPHEVNADQLLRQADQTMYQAKLLGKNRYHLFDTEHDQDLREHQEHLLRIYQGMVKEEFILHYQPKVNMHSGELIGVEALVRWQHPQEVVLPPSFFLPAIAEQPFAIELGEWVIDQALTQVDIWLQAGHTIPVSVNIGAYQLQQPKFITRLRKLLAAHPRVDPGLLELEVLETSALADIYKASRIMHACQKICVRFALDDFGTGYSSLAYLKHLPAATLKIDRTFVRDMLDDLAILEGIIGMAAAFRRRVIAEGVESVARGDR
ncbi:MAG: EAL domain-containing protein, partial [Candidatus Sedimenticola endophacoides]